MVAKFFRVFDAWDWPNPVVLTPPSAEDARAWNPRLNPRDRAHLAPIVTPAHPTMNSSYNVGEPQLRAIRSELGLGMHATRRVEQLARSGATPRQLRKAWRKLFAPSDFFVDYRHYVQVDVSAADDDALRRWTAWCESRLRNLVVALDSPGHVKARVRRPSGIETAPLPRPFETTAFRAAPRRRRGGVAAASWQPRGSRRPRGGLAAAR